MGSTPGVRTPPAMPYLELDHFLRRQAQVHAVAALELEGAFVELGDGLIHVQHGVLLRHLPDDLRASSGSVPGMVPGKLRGTQRPGPRAWHLWGRRLTRGGRVMPVAVQTSWTTEP